MHVNWQKVLAAACLAACCFHAAALDAAAAAGCDYGGLGLASSSARQLRFDGRAPACCNVPDQRQRQHKIKGPSGLPGCYLLQQHGPCAWLLELLLLHDSERAQQLLGRCLLLLHEQGQHAA